jgi:hypothetical protein
MAKTSFTSVGSSADSQKPALDRTWKLDDVAEVR